MDDRSSIDEVRVRLGLVESLVDDLRDRADQAGDDYPEDASGSEGQGLSFAFMVSSGVNSEGDRTINVSAGKRCAYGSANHNAWATVEASGPFDYVSGHSVYMTWTNTTADTPGAWSNVLYGSLPAQTEALQVIEIATITDGEEPVYGNVGNIKVYDVGECE